MGISAQGHARVSSPRIVAGFLLLGCWSAHAATLDMEIQGIEGELLDNVRASLRMQRYEDRDVSPAQVRLMYDSAAEQIREALQPFGYYRAMVESELLQTEDGFRAIFRVQPGEPVIVRDVHVEVRGGAADLPEIRAALQSFAPQEGARLQDSVYENSKEAVDAELRSAGFLDAKLTQHRVAVTLADNSAQIDVVWESGERHRFGAVRFSEAQFGEEFLDGYVPWEQGDPYAAEKLLTLQQRLIDADYFSVVSVQPDLQHTQDDEVPVDVLLVPDERSVYSAELYMSTDTGPGGRLGIQRRWLNRRGHKAEGEMEYSERLQEISANYRIPRPGPFNRNYTFGAAYLDEQTDSSLSRSTTLAAAEGRERWHGFNRTLGVQYLDSDFEIAAERRASALMYADAALTRRDTDDPVFPLEGYTLTLGARAAAEAVFSDTDLLQLRAQGKWIRSAGRGNRIILRGELGAMTVGDFDALPPRLRFFAGGDRSIRGFDYQEIGERNANGVIGGQYLASAGVEYEHFFLPDWGAAVFADAGDAFTADFDLHAGVGFGVRWKSPVGVVRLDFAKPVAGELADGWRIHFVIGPDL